MSCPAGGHAVYDIRREMCSCEQPSYPGPDIALARDIHVRQAASTTTSTTTVSDTVVPTYLPPAPTDATPVIVQFALASQPQDNAMIVGAIPHFDLGYISFNVQFLGQVAGAVTLNASTTIPRGSIGMVTAPNITVVPQTTIGGSPQVTLETALIIAVNMISSSKIAYWVQLDSGEIIKVIGDNLVHDIDLIDPTASIQLTFLTTTTATSPSSASANKDKKKSRALGPAAGHARVRFPATKLRQVVARDCRQQCPSGTVAFETSRGHCGCEELSAGVIRDILRRMRSSSSTTSTSTGSSGSDSNRSGGDDRAVQSVSVFTATMTAETCALMRCINNGGARAQFNPFQAICVCRTREYFDSNPSGESSVHSRTITSRRRWW